MEQLVDKEWVNDQLQRHLHYRLSPTGFQEFTRILMRATPAILIASLEATEFQIEQKQLTTQVSRHRYLCGVMWNKIKQAEVLDSENYFE